jgi:hypothetical protein
MLYFTLWGTESPIDNATSALEQLPSSRHQEELIGVLDLLEEQASRLTIPNESAVVPLRTHASYTRDEALAAFGMTSPGSVREGVRYLENERADLLFVTLRKSDRHYSPSTMYQDRALSPELFHWQSQSTTSVSSRTGQRYINHGQLGTTVHLFVREERKDDLGIAAPYVYAGLVDYESHSGSRPIDIVWRLRTPLPPDLYVAARAVAA